MANILNYLAWRGDVPLSVAPFNEVDNLILSELAYTPLIDLVPPDGREVPLPEVRDQFFRTHTREELAAAKSFTAKAPLVMDGMVEGARFRDLRMCCHVAESDRALDLQLSATTFRLADGTSYVSFRGTDGTIVGWKEDFNFSFQPETEGQKRAVGYLNRVASLAPGPLRVGGHSKGGNLAIYASSFCDPAVQNRIWSVWSNDGPGFRPEITQREGFQRILPKVVQLIPDTSVIGQLLCSCCAQRVVKSDASGLIQHDAFTWQTRRDGFEPAQLSVAGEAIRKLEDQLLDRVDDHAREEAIEAVFTLLNATGMESFAEINEQKRKSAEGVLSSVLNVSKESIAGLVNRLRN